MFSWFSFYLRYLYDVKSWIFCFIFGSRTLERQYPTRRRQIYGQYRAGRWQGNSNLNNLSSRQLKFSHQTINKTFEKVCISLCLRFAKLAKGITVMTTTIFSILVTDMLMLLVMVMVIAIAIVISMEVTGHSHFLTGVVFPSSLFLVKLCAIDTLTIVG